MLLNIKSKYILKGILKCIEEKRYLYILKYNKELQNKLDMTIDDYKNYARIEIEIILCDELNLQVKNKFINTVDDESLYHIYLDDSKEELNRNYLEKGEKAEKIRVVIKYGIISLSKLFSEIKIIKEIKFKLFNIEKITDMSYMFDNCSSLINLDLSKIKKTKKRDRYELYVL